MYLVARARLFPHILYWLPQNYIIYSRDIGGNKSQRLRKDGHYSRSIREYLQVNKFNEYGKCHISTRNVTLSGLQ